MKKTLTINFPNTTISVQLLSSRFNGNEEYILIDTGCLLYLLRRMSSFMDRLDRNVVKLAVMEQTVEEVAEHLRKSYEEKQERGASIFGVVSGVENFRKLLENDKIRKIANPKISMEAQQIYDRFGEDKLLVYVLDKGSFKGLATQDLQLAQRISKKKIIQCQQLLKAQI